jgi:hypothetical protein
MPTCIFLTAILLTLSLFSVERTQEQTTVPPDTLITLDRFPNAFNSGTRYTLTISSDGKVIFQRFRNPFVERFDPKDIALEPIHATIPDKAVAQLAAEFERIKFFSLKDRYAKTEDGCPGVWSDQGGAEISITISRKTKIIGHYHGCSYEALGKAYPAELTSLEDKIDEVVGTYRWLK